MVRRYDTYYYLCPSCEEYQVVADLSNAPDETKDYCCTVCDTLFSSWEVQPESPFASKREK